MRNSDLLFDALLAMGQTLNLKRECENLTAILANMGYSYINISIEDGDFYDCVTYHGNCSYSKFFKLDLDSKALPNKPIATIVIGKNTELSEQELNQINILLEKFRNVVIACLCHRQATKELSLRQKTEEYLREAREHISKLAMERQEISKELDIKIKEHTQEFQKVIDNLKELALKDPMTGLLNRRQVLELGTEKFKDAVAHEKDLAVIMMDIDDFKQINDNYGHLACDQVIEILGKRLRNLIRTEDLAGRYGGEEFIFFLSCDRETAKAVGERVRCAVAQKAFVLEDGIKLFITVSLGIAFRTPQDRTLEALLKRADALLYQAKKAGKNRLVTDWEDNE